MRNVERPHDPVLSLLRKGGPQLKVSQIYPKGYGKQFQKLHSEWKVAWNHVGLILLVLNDAVYNTNKTNTCSMPAQL